MDMARVAVLGVPRGGTSLIVGLLRLAGFKLPGHDPRCSTGEDARLRGRPSSAQLGELAPGTVWKDPRVGAYLTSLRLAEDWRFVVVHRDPWQVAASDARRSGQSWGLVYDRAHQWQSAIDQWARDREHVRIEHEVAQRAPVETYRRLVVAVGGRADRTGEVARFASRAGGYRCPEPASCPHSHGADPDLPDRSASRA